jgi:hypothetical protein
MDPEFVANMLFSVGGAAIVAAVINAIMGRKKLSAEATQIITEAAGGFVQKVEADNARLRSELSTAKARIDGLERREDEARHYQQVHVAIDVMMLRRLRELAHGEDFPEPPPLYPPRPSA